MTQFGAHGDPSEAVGEESYLRTPSDSGLDDTPATAGAASPAEVESTPAAEDAGPHLGDVDPAVGAVEAAELQGRFLKLVLSLTPRDAGGYCALLAVGGDDCDPLFLSVTVGSIPAALTELASLVAEAQAHWQIQPRNTAVPKKSGGTSVRRPGTNQPRSDQPQALDRESPDSEPVPAGQLTLFG